MMKETSIYLVQKDRMESNIPINWGGGTFIHFISLKKQSRLICFSRTYLKIRYLLDIRKKVACIQNL